MTIRTIQNSLIPKAVQRFRLGNAEYKATRWAGGLPAYDLPHITGPLGNNGLIIDLRTTESNALEFFPSTVKFLNDKEIENSGHGILVRIDNPGTNGSWLPQNVMKLLGRHLKANGNDNTLGIFFNVFDIDPPGHYDTEWYCAVGLCVGERIGLSDTAPKRAGMLYFGLYLDPFTDLPYTEEIKRVCEKEGFRGWDRTRNILREQGLMAQAPELTPWQRSRLDRH